MQAWSLRHIWHSGVTLCFTARIYMYNIYYIYKITSLLMNANKISVNVHIYSLAVILSPQWKYYWNVDKNLLGFLCLVGVLCLCLRSCVRIFMLLFRISGNPWLNLVRVGRFFAGTWSNSVIEPLQNNDTQTTRKILTLPKVVLSQNFFTFQQRIYKL
jgi:hypothetical protein